jgi:hypothetical protein
MKAWVVAATTTSRRRESWRPGAAAASLDDLVVCIAMAWLDEGLWEGGGGWE